jgi:hypothetical protein
MSITRPILQPLVVSLWLKEYHSLLWYRSGFNPSIKCDYITNNIVEVFNNWIKDYNYNSIPQPDFSYS